MILLSLYALVVSAIPKRVLHPQDSVFYGQISRKAFSGFKSSNELCEKFYKDWWEDFQRQRLNRSLLMASARKLTVAVFEDDPPDLKWYATVPVQSVEASRLTTVVPGARFAYIDRQCIFKCEDLRVFVEVQMDLPVANRKFTRISRPFAIQCAENSRPVINTVRSKREEDDGFRFPFKGRRAIELNKDTLRQNWVNQCECVPTDWLGLGEHTGAETEEIEVDALLGMTAEEQRAFFDVINNDAQTSADPIEGEQNDLFTPDDFDFGPDS